MDQSRPLFVYFRPFLVTISIKQIEKVQIVCMRFEPEAAGWQVQMKPRSYGGHLPEISLFNKLHCSLKRISKSCNTELTFQPNLVSPSSPFVQIDEPDQRQPRLGHDHGRGGLKSGTAKSRTRFSSSLHHSLQKWSNSGFESSHSGTIEFNRPIVVMWSEKSLPTSKDLGSNPVIGEF